MKDRNKESNMKQNIYYMKQSVFILCMIYGSIVVGMAGKMRYFAAFPDLSENNEKLYEEKKIREFERRPSVVLSAPNLIDSNIENPITLQATVAQSPYRSGVAYLLAQSKKIENAQDQFFSRVALSPLVVGENYSEQFRADDKGLRQIIAWQNRKNNPISQFDIHKNRQFQDERERALYDVQNKYADQFIQGSLSVEQAIEAEKKKIHFIKQTAADLKPLSMNDIENIRNSKRVLGWLDKIKKEQKKQLQEQEKLAHQRAKLRAQTVGVSQKEFVPRLNISRGDQHQLLEPYSMLRPQTPEEITAKIVQEKGQSYIL